MKVIQNYQQGAKHSKKNQPCEDRTFSMSKNGVNVIALADGAGSQRYTHSALGAECVTSTVCNFFCNNFDKFYNNNDIDELKAVIIAVCQYKLKKLAGKLNLDGIIRLSSTLLAVAIKDDKVIICHIGDGVIGKLTPRGAEVVSVPDNGEFASTTFFVTNPKANEHINIMKENINDTYSYFLMSDGLSEHVYNETKRSFFKAVNKMAMLTTEDDGELVLGKIIKNYVIDKDSLSDDCSFICINQREFSINDTHDIVEKNNNKSSKNSSIEKVYKSDSSIDASKTNKVISHKYNNKLILICIVAIVIFMLIFGALINKNHRTNNDTSITSISDESIDNSTKSTPSKTEKDKTAKTESSKKTTTSGKSVDNSSKSKTSKNEKNKTTTKENGKVKTTTTSKQQFTKTTDEIKSASKKKSKHS